MHNMVYLIGRIVELRDDNVRIAVQRSYKNEDGIYETDFIRCILWNGIATNTAEYCKRGDLVGVKGRLQTRKYEVNEEVKYITEVIVDRISFLASKKGEQ